MGLADVVFGSLLTLTAALLMWRIGPRVVALAAPVVVNGLGVGAELALILHLPFWPSVGFVALGEAVVLFSGGLLVLSLIRSHGARARPAPGSAATASGDTRPDRRGDQVRLGRRPDELRPLTMERDVAKFADGSVLVRLGDTHVLCTAKSVDGVPGWRRGSGARLADRRVQHAARGDHRPHAARGGARQAGRPHPGDPAAHRPQPAGGGRPRLDRRAHALHGLRRAAGRRRHAHGLDLGRLRRAGHRPREAASRWRAGRGCRCSKTWPPYRSAWSTARRGSTSTTKKTRRPRST